MKALKDQINTLMIRNRRKSGEYQYTVPSPETYPFQWLWDSCFHAIILCHFNPEDAKKELLSLTSRQFDNGMIPHILCWDSKLDPKSFNNPYLTQITWGKKDTSSITQPPMIAYASLRIYQTDHDKKFLKNIYQSISKFCRYLLDQRDPHGNNLIGIINPDESGEDNSPRFDTALELPSKHTMGENFKKRLELITENKNCNFEVGTCMSNFFWVKDVPFNSIFIANLNAQAKIASILGKNEDARFFKKKAEDISKAMRKFMLEDNIFWSTFSPQYKKIKVLTWAIFAPLFAGILTKDEAKYLVDNYLLDKNKFNLDFILPTVCKTEPSFDPEGFWRGPIWFCPNWFVYIGLKNYGFDEQAQRILDSSLSLIEKSGFREYFNPLTAKGLGAKDFTWGGLILDMS